MKVMVRSTAFFTFVLAFFLLLVSCHVTYSMHEQKVGIELKKDCRVTVFKELIDALQNDDIEKIDINLEKIALLLKELRQYMQNFENIQNLESIQNIEQVRYVHDQELYTDGIHTIAKALTMTTSGVVFQLLLTFIKNNEYVTMHLVVQQALLFALVRLLDGMKDLMLQHGGANSSLWEYSLFFLTMPELFSKCASFRCFCDVIGSTSLVYSPYMRKKNLSLICENLEKNRTIHAECFAFFLDMVVESLILDMPQLLLTSDHKILDSYIFQYLDNHLEDFIEKRNINGQYLVKTIAYVAFRSCSPDKLEKMLLQIDQVKSLLPHSPAVKKWIKEALQEYIIYKKLAYKTKYVKKIEGGGDSFTPGSDQNFYQTDIVNMLKMAIAEDNGDLVDRILQQVQEKKLIKEIFAQYKKVHGVSPAVFAAWAYAERSLFSILLYSFPGCAADDFEMQSSLQWSKNVLGPVKKVFNPFLKSEDVKKLREQDMLFNVDKDQCLVLPESLVMHQVNQVDLVKQANTNQGVGVDVSKNVCDNSELKMFGIDPITFSEVLIMAKTSHNRYLRRKLIAFKRMLQVLSGMNDKKSGALIELDSIRTIASFVGFNLELQSDEQPKMDGKKYQEKEEKQEIQEKKSKKNFLFGT